MTDTEVLRIAMDAMQVATKIAGPMLAVALIVGVLVSLFQAVTQVQEMSLTFVPKLIGVGLVILLGGSWMMREMVGWVTRLWQDMGGMT